MINTKKIAMNMELDEFLKEYYKNYTVSWKQMKLLILDIALGLHPYEELIYKKDDTIYISPRGIDFVQEVMLPVFCEMVKKDENFTKTKFYKKVLQGNIQWTDQWIRKISNEKKQLNDFVPKKDIKTKNFYTQFKIDSKLFNNKKNTHSEIKCMIDKKGNINYIKKEYLLELLCLYFPESFMKSVSFWFSNEIKNLKELDMSITIKKYPEIEKERKKRKYTKAKPPTKQKTKMKQPQMIPVKSKYINIMGIAEMEIIKKELQDWHPHEKMIYKVWDTEKEIAGEIFFTFHGADWYTKIYKPIEKQRSNVFFHEKEERYKLEKLWMEQLLQKENISIENGLNEMPSVMRNIYQFYDIEQMSRTFKMMGIHKEVFELQKEEYQILEKELPEMQIRRYSYLYSKTKSYQDSIVQYVNPVKVPKKNVEWLEVDTSEPGWYFGKIMNRHYFYGKGKNEILTLNVQLENGKKMKVRYPQVINRKTAISLMYESGVPIRFEVERVKDVEGEHKRIKQIILFKQIGFILDWNKSDMKYVPVPELGRKRKKKEEE